MEEFAPGSENVHQKWKNGSKYIKDTLSTLEVKYRLFVIPSRQVVGSTAWGGEVPQSDLDLVTWPSFHSDGFPLMAMNHEYKGKLKIAIEMIGQHWIDITISPRFSMLDLQLLTGSHGSPLGLSWQVLVTPSSNSDPSQVHKITEMQLFKIDFTWFLVDSVWFCSLIWLLLLLKSHHIKTDLAYWPSFDKTSTKSCTALQALVLLQSLEKKLESQTEVPWTLSLRLNAYAAKHCNCSLVDSSFLGNRVAEKSLQTVVICDFYIMSWMIRLSLKVLVNSVSSSWNALHPEFLG